MFVMFCIFVVLLSLCAALTDDNA